MIRRELLDILVCPACKGSLVNAEAFLICNACKLKFPIQDDIPIMLVEEALPLEASLGSNETNKPR